MKKIIVILLLVFCFFQIFVRDFAINYYEETSGAPPDLFYTPDAKYIKPFVLGYENLMADLIWIRTIAYFADQFTQDKQFKDLENLLYVIVDLEPMFEKVYLWGGSVLMYNGNWINKKSIEASTRFLKHGWNYIKNQKIAYRHDPEYWRIPHMIGFNYAIELRDRASGIPYIEEVAKIEGTPKYYKTWASTLYKKEGQKNEAVKSLERELIVENLRTALGQNINENLKREIMMRLKSFYKDLYDEEYAEKKIAELVEETNRLKEIYAIYYAYMPASLFLVMNGQNLLNAKEGNFIDMFFFPEAK